jgi:hypothetical protein
MADVSTVNERSAKLPLFKGQQEHWSMWWRRFQAYADVNRFGDVLLTNELATMPAAAATVLDPATVGHQPQILARKQ